MKIVQIIPTAGGRWQLRKQRPNTSSIGYEVACWALLDSGEVTPMILDMGKPKIPPKAWEYYVTRFGS